MQSFEFVPEIPAGATVVNAEVSTVGNRAVLKVTYRINGKIKKVIIKDTHTLLSSDAAAEGIKPHINFEY